jgi:hypothetical protein
MTIAQKKRKREREREREKKKLVRLISHLDSY